MTQLLNLIDMLLQTTTVKPVLNWHLYMITTPNTKNLPCYKRVSFYHLALDL